VLITGETGTGKELCARAIHHVSGRREAPFIAFDCGAIPDHLIENELFGHARGAFTDAHREQKGLVELAEGGTLFLDEVDSLSLSSQAKLLRLLQERTYRSLGSDKFSRANVKVIAATNQNLEMLVRDQTFRADLYFRLDVLRVHMVPLRERRSDIPPLCQLLGCAGRQAHYLCFFHSAEVDDTGMARKCPPAS
jgi:two-component system response regulator AtoC